MARTLEQANYLSLTTFRRSGEAVATPVWFAADGDTLFVFSAREAGKVKRLRHTQRVRVAPCTVTGQLLGDWQDTQARLLLTDTEIRQAQQALRRRYGWQMLMVDIGAWFGRRLDKRAWIAIDRPA